MKILFVCTGNTCRSPMAEAIAANRLAGTEHRVRSAGTGASEGSPRTDLAGTALREIGIVPRAGTATPLSADLLQWADLVLGMELKHRDRARALAHESGLADLRPASSGLAESGPAPASPAGLKTASNSPAPIPTAETIVSLGEWAGEPELGVVDPYFEGTLAAYRETRDMLIRLIDRGLKRHGLRE